MGAHRKRVLVVDDEPQIRSIVADLLRDAGYDVDTAENGLEALKQMHRDLPDAIVLDLLMPVMDGWTFVDECRNDPDGADVPIVVLSGVNGLTEVAQQMHRQRVTACVEKPFDVDALVEAVDRLAH